jgi:hypothetical protein
MSRYQELLEMTRTPGDDCIVWPHGDNGHGYGILRVNGKPAPAHREALHVFSPAPKGKVCTISGEWTSGDKLDAAHGPCHNRRCVNPLHLSWLTRRENIANGKRDQNGHVKLDVEEVAEIRAAYATGQYRQRELAEQYGVHNSQISRAVNGKTW